MTLNNFIIKLKYKFIFLLFQAPRIRFYSFLSTIKVNCIKIQPVLIEGNGKINISQNVTFGVKESPFFYSGYSFLNVRGVNSCINISSNCFINNNFTAIADIKSITIESNCLIGTNVEIINSDFHDLNPENRFGGKNIKRESILIKSNVFIGNNVKILKGVTIGKNSVIANGSVVVKSIPENAIAGGNPAKVIKQL